ncbi:putative beta-glucosidase G, partial [Colletotrichum shisoi]
MSAALSLVLSGLLLAPSVAAQSYDAGGRSEEAFSWVQPLNTTILGPYGHSEAVYPSPKINGNGWEDALAKARAFVAELTVEEKADMVTGQPGPCVGNIVAVPRLGFQGLCLQDGPLSIRVADYASVFSAGVSAASTWDKDILYERGLAMGKEFKAKGAHVALSPVAGPLGRSAYSGRNWEGFSPDPYLTGVAMYRTIVGHQDAGVQATAKHWLLNEQEIMRNPTFVANGSATDIDEQALSSNVDDRTVHEIYMWPFAEAVKARASAFMCAYQRINGSYACQNSKALNGLLKTELGFDGYVMSDWGAYGMNWKAGSFFGGNVTKAVNNGTLDVARVDDMIVRIMTPYYRLGQDKDFPSVDPSTGDLNTFSPKSTWVREFNLTGERSRDVRADHGELIRKHGAAATVLLKNENGALPLKAPRSIAVFGNDAGEDTQGFYNQDDFEYGTLTAGGGSGTGRLTYLVTPLEAIKARAGRDGALVQQWLNNTHIIESNITDLWVPDVPDVCLVFLKTWAEEAADRQHLDTDWRGNAVVDNVARSCNNTVVVTHSSPATRSSTSSTGHYGDVNPSARLPYTIALDGADYNAPPTTAVNTTGWYDWQSWFDEKLEIDYRHFDAHDIPVRYEFGFGLSCTTFELGDLAAEPVVEGIITTVPEQRPVEPGGNPALWDTVYNATVSVTNTGDVEGAAVPQLYVGFPADTTPAGTPPRQLRGFDKVPLAVGETKTVGFALRRRDLSYWDVVSQDWLIPAGEFTLSVGWSSRDLKAFTKITPVQAITPV